MSIDWDRLEAEVAEVADVDDPRAAMTERVLAAARRRALRRRATHVVLALVAVVAVGVGIPVALGAARHTPDPTSAAGRADPDVRAQIYAAALAGGPDPQPLQHRLYVHDRVCDSVPSQELTATCEGARVPAAVQADVRALVGPRVRFLAAPPPPDRVGDATVVSFGALHVRDDRATLAMQVLCGPMCAQGETLVLRRHDGQWQVSGTTGPAWIT